MENPTNDAAAPEPARSQEPPPGKNRLAFETSPYLLQHADNPVDWYPWGDEAFAVAKELNKPVLVSIGYSSCHWCHVMEHESFEDPDIAALMNELFVCVKIDREERPDVDEIYMTAVQMMGQRGGWPLNVFVSPDGTPFFGGTYFPPRSFANRPGWPDLLRQVSAAWKEQPEQVAQQSARLVEALQGASYFPLADGIPDESALNAAALQLSSNFDKKHGGFGGAPKFPPHLAIQFLLRRHARTGQTHPLDLVRQTLDAMARGGMYDHLGGGFHRYSVDEKWLVPHFEKMLYDNAQLARVYVEAFLVTKDPAFERIARETLDYTLREMTEPSGGFRSATDADSEGREGTYFVWRKAEIEELLGEEADLFVRAYGVTAGGNFEDPHHPTPAGEQGMNVLSLPVPLDQFAKTEGISLEELEERLARSRAILFEKRHGREYPFLDDKVIAAWNGLMIGAMAYAGRAFDEPRYLDAAEAAASFVLEEMRTAEGRLFRTSRGGESKIPAFLDDYAFLASALLDLYEATFDPRWFQEASALVRHMDDSFWDEENGGYFFTAHDAEDLITRMKVPTDGSIPGGNGEAVRVLVRLATMTGDSAMRERAETAMKLFRVAMERMPGGTMGLLVALDMILHEDGEIAIVGSAADDATQKLVRAVHGRYLPGTVVALLDPTVESGETIPLLDGKTLIDGQPAAYVCENFACQAPVTSVADLEKLLAEL